MNKVTLNKNQFIPNNNFHYYNQNEEINLSQVNQKIKLDNNKRIFTQNKKNTEELLVKVFDPNEDFPLPEDYFLDDLNDASINFLKRTQKEEELLFQQKNTILDFEKDNDINNINIISNINIKPFDKNKKGTEIESNTNTNQIFHKEEIIYNLNVNNNSIFEKNYFDFGINRDWKNIILHEFKYINTYFFELKENKNFFFQENLLKEEKLNYISFLHLSNLNKENKDRLSYEDIIREYRLQKENVNNIISPPSDNMTTFLAVKLNNKNVIKLIKHFTRILLEKKNLYNLFMWVYTLLSFLQKPNSPSNSKVFPLRFMKYIEG